MVHYTAVQYSTVQCTAPQVQGRGRGGLQAEHVQGVLTSISSGNIAPLL